MKTLIFFAVSVFALTLLCQFSINALTPAPTPTPPAKPIVGSKPILGQPQPKTEQDARKTSVGQTIAVSAQPDLVVTNIWFTSFQEDGKSRIRLEIKNIGDPKFATANAKGPIEIWLRVWKPSVEQDAMAAEPGVTSYVWGGTAKTEGLAAGATLVATLIVPVPPGGWHVKCKTFGLCTWDPPFVPGSKQTSLRLAARVDPKNSVKESNEMNNDKVFLSSIYVD